MVVTLAVALLNILSRVGLGLIKSRTNLAQLSNITISTKSSPIDRASKYDDHGTLITSDVSLLSRSMLEVCGGQVRHSQELSLGEY